MSLLHWSLLSLALLTGAVPDGALAQSTLRSMDGASFVSESAGESESFFAGTSPEDLFESGAAAAPRPSRSAGPFGAGSGGPMGGGSPPGYEFAWYPTQSVSGQAADLGFVRQGLSLGAPLWRGERDMVMARVSVRNTLFSTDALLPDSQLPFPDQLWNVNLGLNWMHEFDNGWMGGVMTGFGSASDQPFKSLDEFTANLGAFLRLPARNDRDAWQFSLMYMYGGPVDFPIPMIAYSWNPSDELNVNLGLPFSVKWRPLEDLTVNLSYMPLYTINAKLQYQLSAASQVFGGYEFLNESYFLADRVDQQDRFFSLEQRVIAGWRWQVARYGTLELNGGYSFGRRYGQGITQWSDLRDQVDVAPSPFVGVNFQLQF